MENGGKPDSEYSSARKRMETTMGHMVTYHLIQTEAENVYSTDYAWAQMKGGSTAYASTKSNYYYRDYTWNERNLLSQTKDDSYTTEYLYGGDGQRAVKRSSVSETLYFNKFFTQRYDDAYQGAGGRMSKHIFLGSDRIVTKQVALGTGEDYDNADTGVERKYTYYYHADHLGSTSVVTDRDGEVYERLEYTPYGETWLDETSGDTYFDTPYRFSAKEKDEETGLYYYGARYLDPKYSRWISADPALGEYIPQAGSDNSKLPAGGIYNSINLNLYHYGSNNPIRYTDPNGMWTDNEDGTWTAQKGDTLWGLQEKTGQDWHSFGYEGDPSKLQVGETVGHSDGSGVHNLVNFNAGYTGDGTRYTGDGSNYAKALYLSTGADLRPESGQCNLNTEVGVAKASGSVTALSGVIQ